MLAAAARGRRRGRGRGRRLRGAAATVACASTPSRRSSDAGAVAAVDRGVRPQVARGGFRPAARVNDAGHTSRDEDERTRQRARRTTTAPRRLRRHGQADLHRGVDLLVGHGRLLGPDLEADGRDRRVRRAGVADRRRDGVCTISTTSRACSSCVASGGATGFRAVGRHVAAHAASGRVCRQAPEAPQTRPDRRQRKLTVDVDVTGVHGVGHEGAPELTNHGGGACFKRYG